MVSLFTGGIIRRLTENEEKVLSHVLHDARQSVAEIARVAKMRHHTVSYALQMLRDDKLIYPYLLTNPHTLGLTDYCIFFNYLGEEQRSRQKIIDFCTQSPQVAYFAEFSGAYQFSVSIFARSISEVSSFFSALGTLLPRSAFERSFAIRSEWTQFMGNWFGRNKRPFVLSRLSDVKLTSIDELDQKILGYYSLNTHEPLQKVARNTKISESNIRYRLSSLEKRGVIIKRPYYFDSKKAGFTTFRILIAAKGLNPKLRDSLFNFMAKHRYASAFVHCVGNWDFELSFDVADSVLVGEINEEVHDAFGPFISTAHSIQEIAVHRAHHFPNRAGI